LLMRSMAPAAFERTGLTRKSLRVGSLSSRGIVTWLCCAVAGEAEAVMEGVGADGRALTFETAGTVRANAQPASRQSSSTGSGREQLECILRIKGKGSKVLQSSV
jgi:hypothetical protein